MCTAYVGIVDVGCDGWADFGPRSEKVAARLGAAIHGRNATPRNFFEGNNVGLMLRIRPFYCYVPKLHVLKAPHTRAGGATD